ncbi:unnamed protein product, partial [Polarella glacialis]
MHFRLLTTCQGLATYASHNKTGAAMPAELRESCRSGRSHFAHFEAAQQLMYAVVDQAFYACSPSSTSEEQAAAEVLLLLLRPVVHRHLAKKLARFDQELDGPYNGTIASLLGLSKPSKFDHLVHYDGSYYCYLFNRALSAH